MAPTIRSYLSEGSIALSEIAASMRSIFASREVVFEAIAKGYEQTAHLHGSVDRALWYHRSILGAIRAKDADLSGSLTRQHIEQALRDIAEHRKGA